MAVNVYCKGGAAATAASGITSALAYTQ